MPANSVNGLATDHGPAIHMGQKSGQVQFRAGLNRVALGVLESRLSPGAGRRAGGGGW